MALGFGGGRKTASGQEQRTASQPKTGGAAGKRSKRTKSRATVREWINSLVLALAIFFIVRLFVFQNFVIISGSMENTLLVGDFVLVNRAAIGSRVPGTDIRIPGYSEPRFGDVMVFDPHHEENMTLIKRLVGLPGDTLEMRDNELYRNGVAEDEPYVITTDDAAGFSPAMLWQQPYLLGGPREDYRPTRATWGPIVIPEGYYFMLGDNRDGSLDSRFWGLLEGWRLEGRASRIYFSYNRDSYRPFPWIREVRAGRIGDRIR